MSHYTSCKCRLCYPDRLQVNHRTLHIRDMVRSETNAQYAMRKAKNELYTLEADVAALQRDLERQARNRRYRSCNSDTDFVYKYDKYNLADFLPPRK